MYEKKSTNKTILNSCVDKTFVLLSYEFFLLLLLVINWNDMIFFPAAMSKFSYKMYNIRVEKIFINNFDKLKNTFCHFFRNIFHSFLTFNPNFHFENVVENGFRKWKREKLFDTINNIFYLKFFFAKNDAQVNTIFRLFMLTKNQTF